MKTLLVIIVIIAVAFVVLSFIRRKR